MYIIYDDNGEIYFVGSSKPTGDIHVLTAEQKNGCYIKMIDTSQTPHQPIFEEYPKSEMQVLKEANEQQQADIDFLMLLLE